MCQFRGCTRPGNKRFKISKNSVVVLACEECIRKVWKSRGEMSAKVKDLNVRLEMKEPDPKE